MADVIDGRIGSHALYPFQMPFQFIDPVPHPLPVFIEDPQRLHMHFFFIDGFPGDISIRTVHDSQEIRPAHGPPLGQPYISEKISRDPVVVQIRQPVSHIKRDLVLHKEFRQKPRLLTCPKEHSRLPQIAAALLPLLDLL